jgi:hypothetical protein
MQVICHGIPDRRPLEDGDIVNVDVTAYLNGFHGDLNETYVVGAADDASRRLIRVTSEVRGAAAGRQARRLACEAPPRERGACCLGAPEILRAWPRRRSTRPSRQ